MTETVLDVMEECKEPFLTLPEITEEVDVSKKTVHDRLMELHEEGEVNRKKVGGRAVVWWLPMRYQNRRNQASESP